MGQFMVYCDYGRALSQHRLCVSASLLDCLPFLRLGLGGLDQWGRFGMGFGKTNRTRNGELASWSWRQKTA